MKVFLFAILLVAGAIAMPPQSDLDDSINGRIVTGNIIRAIERVSQEIKDAGLDPLEIERLDINESPVPILVTIVAFIDSLKFHGLSNIAVNRMDYGALTNRLRFDVSLPLVGLSIGDSGVNANIFGNRFTGSFRGTLEIIQMRIQGEIRVNIGIISGISLRDVNVGPRLGKIESNLALIFNGNNYSPELNLLLNERIPEFLLVNQERIDKALSDFIKDTFNNSRGTSLAVEDGVLVPNSL